MKSDQPDIDKEKKTNKNLAIGIGVLGFSGFVLFYVLLFAVMIIRPGLMLSILPKPTITDKAVSDGNKTYLLAQKVDLSTMNPREKHPPETRHFLTVLDGAEPGASQEIPVYEHAFGAGGRLVFLSKGGFRTYDGVRWVEEKSDAIGKDPRGILTPAGLYVLSSFDAGPRLVLIGPGMTSAVPLPTDYLASGKKEPCPCAKMAWYQGRLCLFWTAKDSISWAELNGSSWSPAAASPYSGKYEVVANDQDLYFFHGEGEGPARTLSYYIFTNDAWSGPARLPIQGSFTNWDVFFQQGKLKLFTRQFMTQTLYTIENGNLLDPVRLKGPFDPARMMGRTALVIVVGNALAFLAVFGFSALINRFKRPVWTERETTYEFASLFRRFLATIIDNLVLLVPAAIMIAVLMPKPEELAGHPFQLLAMIFSVIFFIFVGGYLYHSLLEGLLGQTLGKKLCRIRVVKADFTPCSLSDGFLRNLMRIVDAFFSYLVAAVSLAATLKWQRLGDLVADTVVVKDRRRVL